jgi:hypothetical protein
MHKSKTAATSSNNLVAYSDRSSKGVFFFLLRFIYFMKMIVSWSRVAVQHNKQKDSTMIPLEENDKKSLSPHSTSFH